MVREGVDSMINKDIQQPHGYLLDEDGKVIQRFGNWETGPRKVHAATVKIEYVDGPNVHEKTVNEKYKPVK